MNIDKIYQQYYRTGYIHSFLFFILMIHVLIASALSLGDTFSATNLQQVQFVSGATNAVATVNIKLVQTMPSYKLYRQKTTTGETTILVNNQQKVYGFQWQDKDVNVRNLIGQQYIKQFDTAFAARTNPGNHRFLMINTPTLVVKQFGLPGGVMTGEMYARDMQP